MTAHEFPIALPRDVAVFGEPRWLVPATPAWIEHMPFAFWIVAAQRPASFVELGTHYGNSYFAFAEAMEELGLDCAAYAVDTWQGDEHSGRYGDEVFLAVHDHNARHYSRFSSLVRSTFDEAASHFGDGEIDLLHIDGHHTYASAKHDFDLWLPKLSERSIVLFHDIGVRERGFGVHELWTEISAEYPSFGFDHSHGLGVAGIGGNQAPLLTALFELDPSDAVVVKRVFSRLGRALSADARSAEREAAVRAELEEKLHREVADLRGQFDAERSRIEADVAEHRASVTREIDRLSDVHAREIAALELSVRLAEERAAARFDAKLHGGEGS